MNDLALICRYSFYQTIYAIFFCVYLFIAVLLEANAGVLFINSDEDLKNFTLMSYN